MFKVNNKSTRFTSFLFELLPTLPFFGSVWAGTDLMGFNNQFSIVYSIT